MTSNRLFGFETEVARGGPQMIRTLHKLGLSQDSHLHAYHCRCDACAPHRPPKFPITGQEDCTVSGEFITRATPYGTDEADAVFHGMARALAISGAKSGLEAGNHVHVSKEGMNTAGFIRLVKLFDRYIDTLRILAAGPAPQVRGYNGGWGEVRLTYRSHPRGYRQSTREGLYWFNVDKADEYGATPVWSGELLGHRWNPNTHEFRLWNSTTAEWRLRLYVGVSVGMMEAALHGYDAIAPGQTAPDLLAVIAPYVDDHCIAGYLRQLHSK